MRVIFGPRKERKLQSAPAAGKPFLAKEGGFLFLA
jgi:hypothetical protein